MAESLIETRQRHARFAQAALRTLSVPVCATLEVLADPAVTQGLCDRIRSGPDGLIAVILLIARVAHAFPALVAMERQAVGLTSENVDLKDKPALSFADAIAKDPHATELAIALVDRMAGTGPCTDAALSTHDEPRRAQQGAAPQTSHPENRSTLRRSDSNVRVRRREARALHRRPRSSEPRPVAPSILERIFKRRYTLDARLRARSLRCPIVIIRQSAAPSHQSGQVTRYPARANKISDDRGGTQAATSSRQPS
ncbi:MAG: hypothetical protein ABJA98_07000 [Acidobacteriota bacterium]